MSFTLMQDPDTHFYDERRRRAIETISEDERLTSDLTDDQAKPLLEWASYQVNLVASDPSYSDEAVEGVIQSVRRAVRQVGRSAADEFDPERLVSLARTLLQKGSETI